MRTLRSPRPWLVLAAALPCISGTLQAQVHFLHGSGHPEGGQLLLGAELNGKLLYTDDWLFSGGALWKSDGSKAGTSRVYEYPPTSTFGFGAPTRAGNLVFFSVPTSSHTLNSLCRSDGTRSGTSGAGNELSPRDMAEHGGLLYFNGAEPTSWPYYQRELWVSDGTTATTRVVDLEPGPGSSSPTTLRSILGKLYFVASTSATGREPVISDGTASGTSVVDTVPGPTSGNAGDFAELGGAVYFMAADGLWRSDGTLPGTVRVADVCVPSCGSTDPLLGAAGGLLYLAVDDGVRGTELWRSDGTAAGTFRVADIEPGAGGSDPRCLAFSGGRTVFSAWTSTGGREIWTTDGTASGTSMVKDINPGPGDGGECPVAANGRFYFAADDGGVTGRELWTSDGTASGTHLVQDVNPGSGGSRFSEFQQVGATLFLRASDPGYPFNSELWALSFTCGPMAFSPASLPDGDIGLPYSAALSATGGTAPYTWDAHGAMPPGISLSTAGVLSGTPAVGGTYELIVTASDAAGCASSQIYRIDIHCEITISPATLPAGALGVTYSHTLAATGGTAPYSFSVTAGQLPPGLDLDSSGTLSGTPTSVAATFGFTVTADDAAICAGSQDHAITIVGAGAAAERIVAGRGPGSANPNEVKVYRQDGSPTPVGFLAYGAGAWGVNVAAASIRGGASEEILTGPGPGEALGPQVRAFDSQGQPMAKVSFYAYGTLRFGANASAGELEADGFDEILSGAGPGRVFGPHVRGWNFDGATLTPIARVNFFAYGTLKYGVNVAGGDVDGDDMAELLTGPGPGASFGPQIRGFDHDGGPTTAMAKISFAAFALAGFGASVASGDVEADGFEEILAGPGPGPAHPYAVSGFDFDGTQVTPMAGFSVTVPGTLYGARVGSGDVTGEGVDSVTSGAGWDPAAFSTVRPYRYVDPGGLLVTLLAFDAFPASAYGVNATGGSLGL